MNDVTTEEWDHYINHRKEQLLREHRTLFMLKPRNRMRFRN